MALLRAQAYNEITFVHIPGHTGIALNERVDKMAKAATQGSTRLPPSYDTQWFRLHASAFLGTPTLCTPTPPPTQIDVQTKASLARLSAGLATFIYKMIHDCGTTQARLHRHDRTESNLCRHCSSAPETPSHLWECLGPSSTTTFQQFTDSPSGERAREWLLSLQRHGVTI